VGPLLGGALTSYASWRWAFFINVPFGLLVRCWRFGTSRASRPRGAAPGSIRRLRAGGAAVALLQTGFEAAGHGAAPLGVTAAMMAVAAMLFGLFLAHARRVPVPVLDLASTRIAAFRVGSLVGGVCRIGLNGTPFLLPLMLQIGFGMSPVGSGFNHLRQQPRHDRGAAGPADHAAERSASAACWSPARRFSRLATAGLRPLRAHHLARSHSAPNAMLFGLLRSIQFMSSNYPGLRRRLGRALSAATSVGAWSSSSASASASPWPPPLVAAVAGPHHRLTPAHFHEAFLGLALVTLAPLPRS